MQHSSGNILAIIPARGGSKRLPGKNIRPLAGRPLLAYSILTARACSRIQRVAVSSDADDILNVGSHWGAEPVRRPDDFSNDHATTVSAMQHTLAVCEESGWKADHVALFQCTCPLRHLDDVDKALDQYLAADADSALSVTEIHLKAGKRDANGWYEPQYKVGARKQDIEPLYKEDGAFYLTKAELIREGKLFGPKTMLLEFPPEAGMASIDVEFDFVLTEALYDSMSYEREFSQLERELWQHRGRRAA